MRAVRPDRSEHPKIKRAFRAAIFMKWGLVPLMLIALLGAWLIARASGRWFGRAFLLLAWGALLGVGYSRARCPRCGQVWWSRTGMFLLAPVLMLFGSEDETDSFVCRRCGLDIGLGLRE
jgi:hypothetical protein